MRAKNRKDDKYLCVNKGREIAKIARNIWSFENILIFLNVLIELLLPFCAMIAVAKLDIFTRKLQFNPVGVRR